MQEELKGGGYCSAELFTASTVANAPKTLKHIPLNPRCHIFITHRVALPKLQICHYVNQINVIGAYHAISSSTANNLDVRDPSI